MGRGFEGRAAAQQRGRRRDLGAVFSQIFWLSPLFSSKLKTTALILTFIRLMKLINIRVEKDVKHYHYFLLKYLEILLNPDFNSGHRGC